MGNTNQAREGDEVSNWIRTIQQIVVQHPDVACLRRPYYHLICHPDEHQRMCEMLDAVFTRLVNKIIQGCYVVPKSFTGSMENGVLYMGCSERIEKGFLDVQVSDLAKPDMLDRFQWEGAETQSAQIKPFILANAGGMDYIGVDFVPTNQKLLC